jgi:chemotaxis protein methyltransferase CheR
MDFDNFKKWVMKDFNIDLSAYKSNQLHRRILSLMSRIGVDTLEDYIKLLKKDNVQRQKFLDFITINVTEFFRNPDIFDDFNKILKEDYLKHNSNLKIWSAACSIGAEPYSVSMLLDSSSYRGTYKIIATDIDSTILAKAKKGIYSYNDVKNVKKEYLNKYFRIEGDKFIIDDSVKKNVLFKKHDLILDRYDKEFDIIICRNVVIYFNQDVKDRIYTRFSESLKKGGLLFVGATESIYNYKEFGFEKASTFIYKKL